MKVDNVWRRRGAAHLAGCYLALTLCAVAKTSGTLAAGPLGPSERPEAYFNGSSYIRLSRPISLKQLVGLSFRTCVGGELFSQRFERYTLHVTALFEQVVVSWALPTQPHREVGLARETLDNRWHWVALRYRPNPPSLLLEVDTDTQVISNLTWNPELLTPGALEAGGAVVLVGNLFSGCIHEGPQLEFYANTAQHRNVEFTNCPLTTDACKDRKDVLRIPPKDHCYNEPCMRHGTCISRYDRYECHCTARYTGNNCEVDAGDPCASGPCYNGARCVEDSRGDYTCDCVPPFHGTYCEMELSPHPLCKADPCGNNGSCSVPPGADTFVCTCPPGYSGVACEVDVDECLGAGPDACLNGGRCQDAVNTYTCNCTGTGYTGARCEVNINECLEEPSVCGHGVCYDKYGSFVCSCLPGYTGDRCDRMSACVLGPCGAGGVCMEEEGGGGFHCVCARGTVPPLCTPAPPPPPAAAPPPAAPPAAAPPPAAPPAAAPHPSCADLVCPPRSYCAPTGPSTMVAGVVVTKQVTCFCDIGYYGAPGLSPNCTSLEGACEAGACLNGGTCALGADYFNCTCAPGYKGTYCEQASAAGAPGPAASGVAGGKALSDLKVERCSAQPCLHAKACVDLPGSFHCECEAGWSGQRCEVVAGAEGPGGGGAGPGPEACGARPCLNAGSCLYAAPGGPVCECRPGYGGAVCEQLLDCRAASCPHNQECVEQGGLWRCAAPALDSACASSPCHNGTCLALDNGIFRCQCLPGYTGRVCEIDIDECASKQKLCNHGVCINIPGSYQCYCKPGYTGDSCEQDIDECLSSPCKNGGTCHNLENNYECTCMEGFEGKDCGVNINDCEGNPCAEGSTCIDGIASYSCVCQDGITGANCEIDIDDCESQPCQHGGRCVDGQNSFTCDCSDTGYSGEECSVNVDECAPQPCRHGGTCIDDVNDYHCTCYPAYTGKNCEIDINECENEPCKYGGVCLEHSNTSLYRSPDSAPVQVGPQAQMLLPNIFYQPFSLENASGFECVCQMGTSGPRCETNLDECAPAPCGHGKCVDGVGGYTCHCAAGYEGDHCEIEIDECLRYEPCAHGKCFDGRATYYCSCSAGWGGRNCSVVLEGCRGEPCRNHGTCLPWLHREIDHRFNCTCAPGYYGTTCEKITTMSMERNSYAQVNTSREEGYDMSFRFKTTLGNGLLAMGRGFTYFFLELSSGRLNLHSSLLNKWGGVYIGSGLNDSKWQKVFVTINSSHLVLAANEEQTIYPISQNEANNNSSVTSFPSTRLGNAGSNIARLTHGPNYFVGCFQDVVVNGQWVLPEDSNASQADGSSSSSTEEPEVRQATEELFSSEEGVPVGGGGVRARAVLSGVLASCPRVPQCSPNPCRSGGACEDAWSSFLCTCPRPHLGDTCQYSYTAATFGQESARPRSVVSVQVSEQARRAVHAALDISMFIRTRKPTGQIFYLGSLPRYGQKEETQVGASLEGGELLVHLQFNQTPENYTVGGTRLDNGHLHLIEVVRNSTLVQVKLNGTEYFRKSISAAKQLDAQVLYLGGPPPAPEPPEEALPSAAALVSPPVAPVSAPAAAPAPAPIVPAPVSPAASLAPLPPQSPVVPVPVPAPTLPPTPASTPAPTTQPPPPTTTERQIDDSAYFKGVIQDVQISNGVNVTIVEFFPLQVAGLQLPPPFGEVSLEAAGVLEGVVSDDACASRPCLHNATCTNTWNDFTCVCPRGYKGKQCAEVEFCQLQSCPLNSHCRNLDNGYECVSNATFDGANTTLSYRLRVPRALPAPAKRPDLPDTLTVTYRSKTGGTLLEASGEAGWFSVGVFRSQVSVQWRLGAGAGAGGGAGGAGAGPATRRMRPRDPHHGWTTLRLTFADDHVTGAFIEAEGHEEVGLSARVDVASWQSVMLEGVIYLGGAHRNNNNNNTAQPTPAQPGAAPSTESVTDANVWEYTEGDEFTGDNLAGEYFKGCLGAVHVGSLLLPFFTEEELFVGPAAELLAAQPHYALLSGRPWGSTEGVGCVLCLEQDCERGGHCADVRSSYQCTCPPGYTGDYCQIDIDECLTNQCQNGATCKDGVATYTCICPEGYDGDLCENDIDECVSSPCLHGGLCRDLAGGYSCVCAAEWQGARCHKPHQRTCQHLPCAEHHAECVDHPPEPPTGNNFTCECFEGYEGVYCEFAFCDLNPCVHGTCINDTNPPSCACEAGYSGARCDTERDWCAEAAAAAAEGEGGAACLHGGRCIDARGTYLCDCANTGWTGVRCEVDVDECAAGLVSCGPGDCLNMNGSYTCLCTPGFCGLECALLDPCFAAAEGAEGGDNSTGPCRHRAPCEQRCSSHTDYICHCVDGWGGKNCTQQVVPADLNSSGDRSSTVLIGVGAALVCLALGGGALAALGAQARRKRATRGTYSPSGQEYCNPRAEHMHNALKPPPEERLI